MKGLAVAVQSTLDQYYANQFPGGQNLVYAADKNGVQLPMSTSKFTKFTQAEYDAVYAKLKAGEIKILKDTDVTDVSQIPVSNVKVTFVN
jgi:basic membrane protein A and related proteins